MQGLHYVLQKVLTLLHSELFVACLDDILPSKAKRKYLLTLQVIGYCLLALQSSLHVTALASVAIYTAISIIMYDSPLDKQQSMAKCDEQPPLLLLLFNCRCRIYCFFTQLLPHSVPPFKHVKAIMWHQSARFEKSWPPFCQIWIIFTHLKLWIASARHNFKWVKIPIE